MVIEYWPEKSLSSYQIEKGLEFIRRRFLEEWQILRVDVTYDLILKRKNLILKDNLKLIGWLGIENDGELTNACIEKGYKGVDYLIKMIHKAYNVSCINYMYAEVPICRTASAVAFLKTGMCLETPIKLIKLKYKERDVILVRLSIEKSKQIVFNFDNLERDLHTISYLNTVSDSLIIPEKVIF